MAKTIDNKEQTPYPVERVALHSELLMDGKTERFVDKKHFPKIKHMEWTPNFNAVIIYGEGRYVVPAAAIKYSILTD